MLNFLRGIGSFIADYRVEILAILYVNARIHHGGTIIV